MKKIYSLILVSLLAITIYPLMSYSTNTDLIESVDEKQVMQLVDDENTGLLSISDAEAAAADPASEYHQESVLMLQRITRARSDADEMINAFVRTQYDIPLDITPAVIGMLSVDLTYVNLYERRYRGQLPDGVQSLYDRSMDKLKLIQAGKMSLQDKPDVAAGQIAVRASPKKFSDEFLKRF